MVVLSKILPLLAAGVGIMFLVNAFTRPAHASQTAGAISETFAAFGRGGAAAGEFGQGIGTGLAGLFKPVWEVSNLFERFSSLASGSANVGPVSQVEGGYGTNTAQTSTTNSGSSSPGKGGSSVPGITNYNPGVSITGGSPGVTGSVF